MTIIKLEEVKDQEVRRECYDRVTEAENYEEFKSMFEDISDTEINEAKVQVLKDGGSSDPDMVVFRTTDDHTYEMKGQLSPQREDKEVSFSLKVREDIY